MDRKEMLERLARGDPALEVSIQKWQDIVDGVGEDMGAANCALCEVAGFTCLNCKIYQKMRYTCRKTPYMRHMENPSKKNAQAELDFLKSLR